MALYTLGLTTTNFTIAEPFCSLVAAGSSAFRLYQFDWQNTGSTTGQLGLGRASSAGTPGAATPYNLLPFNPSDGTSKTVAYLDYLTTYPGVPSTYIEQGIMSNSATLGGLWEFPNGLMIVASGTLVVWNIAATGECYVNFVIDE